MLSRSTKRNFTRCVTLGAAVGLSVVVLGSVPARASEDFAVGTIYDVARVKSGDVLNLRSRPDADAPIVARVPPTAKGLISKGRALSTGGTLWAEVATASGETGWVNTSFLKRAPDKKKDCERLASPQERLTCTIDRVAPANRDISRVVDSVVYVSEKDQRGPMKCDGRTCSVDVTIESNLGASGEVTHRFVCTEAAGAANCSRQTWEAGSASASPPEPIDLRTGKPRS